MACSTRARVCVAFASLALGCGPDIKDPADADDVGATDGQGDVGTDGDEHGSATGGDAPNAETDDDPTGDDPTGECVDGYTLVDTEAECLADAHCYAWDGGWCTGHCPDGLGFGQGPSPFCESASCSEEEIFRRAGEHCNEGPGVYCWYQHHALWACETCHIGFVRDGEASTEDALACVEACAEGHEVVHTEDECLADAGCYQLPEGGNRIGRGWCTGTCPEGQTLEIPDDGTLPFCAA
jgi:hypothetical protein